MPTEATRCQKYLAGVEMSVDLNDDLVIFIGGLFPGDHHLSCCQVLQLSHLETHILVTLGESRILLSAECCSFDGKGVQFTKLRTEGLRDFSGNQCKKGRKRKVQLAHRLASLANDPSCCGSGHLDVSLQFDLLLRPKEILLLQFAIDSALSLQEGDREGNNPFNITNSSLVHQSGANSTLQRKINTIDIDQLGKSRWCLP